MRSIAQPAPTFSGSDSPRQGLNRDEVMTATEVSELLSLPVSTVYYLARRGEIPTSRLGRTWRFIRPLIEETLGV